MSNIPTAEKLLEEHFISVDKSNIKYGHYFVIKEAMKEFAKLHVEAALKEASKKAECCADAIVDLGHTIIEAYVEKDSILNAYPLTNIK